MPPHSCVTTSIAADKRIHNRIEFSERNRQWRHDIEHIGQRAEPDAVGERFAADAPGAAFRRRVGQAGGFVGREFQRTDQAALPRRGDVRMLGQAAQVLAESGDFRRQLGERLLLVEHIERRQRRRAGERVAAERVAVVQRAALVKFAEECVGRSCRS